MKGLLFVIRHTPSVGEVSFRSLVISVSSFSGWTYYQNMWIVTNKNKKLESIEITCQINYCVIVTETVSVQKNKNSSMILIAEIYIKKETKFIGLLNIIPAT